MPAKRFFSYIRVSTARQGQHNTSLSEQQAAIDRYARQWNLHIIKQYEERETAARQGRPVFVEMLKNLRQGRADGVIIHKIDRSARNLKDWSDLGSLIDSGIEVLFANESIDLQSRGGRLSADIQAVVASDYIRNLREETIKGLYGRLKQGLYPFPAVIGYKDAGAGQPKIHDPVQAPLVRTAFELYAAGDIGLNALVDKMFDLGLRNKAAGRVTRNGLATILHNPFYTGLIEIKKTGELFAGQHQPIVQKQLFDRVQEVFAGKHARKQKRHFFVFRRFVTCSGCGNRLIPERRKGHAYYRCQTRNCGQKTLREEIIEEYFLETLKKLQFDEREYVLLWTEAVKYDRQQAVMIANAKREIVLKMDAVKHRLVKLADAYVDEVFDKETYFEKKNALIVEELDLKEKLNRFSENASDVLARIKEFLGLLKCAYSGYKMGKQEEKREMVETTVSDFTARDKVVSIKLKKPFEMIYERELARAGSPYRATARTFSAEISRLAKNLYQFFSEHEFADGNLLEYKQSL